MTEESIPDLGSVSDICPPVITNEFQDEADDDHVTSTKYIKGKIRYQCKFCNNYFTSNYLPYHLKFLHSEDNIYTCKVCGEFFKQKYYFNVHMKNHDELKPYKCETCGNRFSQNYMLKLHEEFHANLQFTCKICKKTFKCSRFLERHEKKHTKDKKYGCEICGRKFFTNYHLQAHLKMHSIKLECFICNRKFSNKWQLDLHTVVHTGNFQHPFTCPVCCKFFFKRSALKNHIKTHNRIDKSKLTQSETKSKSKYDLSKKKPVFTCDICKQTYQSKSNLEVHKRRHTGERPYSCEICEKTFPYVTTLKMHKIYKHNSSDAKYRCKICNRGFYTKAQCNDHMNAHTGAKPYQCKICQKHYSTRPSFTAHMKIKHSTQSNPKYKCDFCGKLHFSPSERIIHMRKHTGSLPFYCEKCGKAFASKYARTTHMYTHTLPFECGICNVKFSSRIQLMRHVKTHEAHECDASKTRTGLDGSEFDSYVNTQKLLYECEICHEQYRTKKNLLKHVETHKTIEINNSEITSHMNEKTLPFENGLSHDQYNSNINILSHGETHSAVEWNTTLANSEINHAEDQLGLKVHTLNNTQNEDGLSNVGLTTELDFQAGLEIVNELKKEETSNIHANDNVLEGINFENSSIKMETNPTQDSNINLNSISMNGHDGEKVQLNSMGNDGCFTQSIPQLISLSHFDTNNMAENLNGVKPEPQLNQTANSEHGRSVVVMKKIGSFKVSKEELGRILSGMTVVIKPEASQNNASKS